MTQSRVPLAVWYSLMILSRRLSRLLLLILPESSVASQPGGVRHRSNAIWSKWPISPQSPRTWRQGKEAALLASLRNHLDSTASDRKNLPRREAGSLRFPLKLEDRPATIEKLLVRAGRTERRGQLCTGERIRYGQFEGGPQAKHFPLTVAIAFSSSLIIAAEGTAPLAPLLSPRLGRVAPKLTL